MPVGFSQQTNFRTRYARSNKIGLNINLLNNATPYNTQPYSYTPSYGADFNRFRNNGMIGRLDGSVSCGSCGK